MKICIVGNCQARPVEMILKAMQPDLDCVGSVIVHLTNTAREDEDMALLQQADIIFAQFVQDRYPSPHISTTNLRAAFPGKIVVWQNLFFAGQTPNLAYLSKQGGERVRGPLGEYQRRDIVASFLRGESVADCIIRARAGLDDEFFVITEKSLQEMNARRPSLDVDVCDIIEEEWRRRNLFFTFNHPNSWLLIRLSERLLAHAGVTAARMIIPTLVGEPLDVISAPILPHEASRLGLTFETSDVARGSEVLFKLNKIAAGGRRLYGYDELVAVTYQALERQCVTSDGIRFTPASYQSKTEHAG